MKASEHVLTLAVDAAARVVHEKARAEAGGETPPWEGLSKPEQLPYRWHVLSVVTAAIEAIPDPRFAAWEEGFAAAWRVDDNENPYPYEPA